MDEAKAMAGLFNAIKTIPYLKSKMQPIISKHKCANCKCMVSKDYYPDTKECSDWAHDFEDESGTCPCGCDNPV